MEYYRLIVSYPPSFCPKHQADNIHHLCDKVRLSSADLIGTHCDRITGQTAAQMHFHVMEALNR